MSEIDFSDPAVLAALSAALTQAGVDGIEIEQPRGKLRIVVEKKRRCFGADQCCQGGGQRRCQGSTGGRFYELPNAISLSFG